MMKSLDELCEFKNGLWKGKEGSFKPIKILRNTNFNNDGRFNFIDVAAHEVEIKQLESRVLKYGDIILERSGGGPKQPVGRVAFFDIKDDKGEYSFSNFTTRIRVIDREKLNERFLWRFLHYFYTKGETTRMQRQTHGIRNLDFSEYKKIKVPLPNPSEQKRICEILEKTDILCQQRKQVDELSRIVIQSLFVEMFGDPLIDHKNVNKLSEVCYINPKLDFPISEELEVSFIPMAAVSKNGEFDTTQVKKYKEVRRGFTYFLNGDVLFAKITPCMENGKGAIANNLVNGIGFGSTEFHVLRPSKEILNAWLYCLLSFQHFRRIAAENMTGTAGQQRVPASFLKNLRVFIPPLDKQQKFADLVQSVEKIKETQEESKKALNILFSALMQKAFQG